MNEVSNVMAKHVLGKARERFSQAHIAGRLNYTVRQIARWEAGTSSVPADVVPVLRSMYADGRDVGSPGGDFTFIDLFAGIGGIRIGFEEAGGRCVFTSEWDPYAQKTYAANFGDDHAIDGDITLVDADDVPDHDVLLAGFPCQPFSIAGVSKKNALGRPHGFECTTQGTLFFDVARIIAAKRPAAFLLENVKNLASHDGGNTLRTILHVLREQLGYAVTTKVVDGARFVPQHRERILIVGIRDDDGEQSGFDWDAVDLPLIEDGPRLRDILHATDDERIDHDGSAFVDSRGRVQAKYTLTDNLWTYLQAYAAKHRAKGNGFGCSVVGPRDRSRTLSARYYKDGSEILIDRGRGRNPRRLTPRECARLMGFPDDFRIEVSDTRAYKQFGNSVVVPLVRHVAARLKPYVMAKLAAGETLG